jgi:hypothetical protein
MKNRESQENEGEMETRRSPACLVVNDMLPRVENMLLWDCIPESIMSLIALVIFGFAPGFWAQNRSKQLRVHQMFPKLASEDSIPRSELHQDPRRDGRHHQPRSQFLAGSTSHYRSPLSPSYEHWA